MYEVVFRAEIIKQFVSCLCSKRTAIHQRAQKTFERVKTMNTKRKIEIFSADCPLCEETVELVKRIACPSCEITVLDMKDSAVADHAKSLGVQSVPALAIDGKLAECCVGRGLE